MIPILFNGNAKDFTSNGIGRLTDCISCEVTEERNGQFELVMEYATTGVLYSELEVSKLIVVKPNQKQERQAFEIYQITKPINQIVKVYAHHISYNQSYIPIKPFIATGIQGVIQGFSENALETNDFTFTTTIANDSTTYNQSLPKSLRACLGGSDGSLLDTFSGSGGIEYEWNNFETIIYRNRGANNGVEFRYGKNITELEQDENIEDTVTGVLPMWANDDNTVVFYGDIQYSPFKDNYPRNRTVVLDLSSEFETAPTNVELNQAGQKYINGEGVGLPKTNIKISFVDLASTSQYKDVAVLETVNLCDTVKVHYVPLGISYDAKVIKTVWDVLRGRYNSIEIGTVRSNIAQTIADNLGDIHSLQLANNKLVSVTQTLDREMGEVQTTVATVETKYEDISQDLVNLSTDVENMGDDYSSLATRVEYNETQITQNAQAIQLRATTQYVDSEIGALESQVETLSTTLSVESDQVKISQGNENNYVSIQDNNVTIYTDGTPATSFSNEGMTTSKVIVDSHWYQDTVNNGNSWILYYK